MFCYCETLMYLNMYSFQLNSTINITSAFNRTSENLVFCIKDNYTKNYLFGVDKMSICLEPCSNENNKKINLLIDGCVKSCTNNRFQYEYNNICYHECPNNTYSLYYDDDEDNINNSKECLDKIPEGYYLDIYKKKYKKCYENCKSCYGEGNETDNNCDECKDNLTFYYNSENIKNCYPICNIVKMVL